jgi:hypothetical protein
MLRFEYEITAHPAEEFRRLVYYCGEGSGQCKSDEVPGSELELLAGLLNERGEQGWEAIQVQFGSDSVVVFWKRAVNR